jgi:hypothetical protein
MIASESSGLKAERIELLIREKRPESFSGDLPHSLSEPGSLKSLKSLFLVCLALPDVIRTHGWPPAQEYRLRVE